MVALSGPVFMVRALMMDVVGVLHRQRTRPNGHPLLFHFFDQHKALERATGTS